MRRLANQAFSRASGAPLREGNHVAILKDAAENYPAWLEAITGARRTIHFEMYIVHEDEQGRIFADALARQAQAGVRVRLLYDWMGGFGKTSRRFWRRLRDAGVDVRCYNPPQIAKPLGWVSRDHRKAIIVDGEVGFVTGLCVGQMWVGDPARGLDPWRDTGVVVRGPAVADLEDAFAEAWAASGDPLPDEDPVAAPPAGVVALRVVATVPSSAALFRLDQLVAAMAREHLWLTDAYYGGTAPYFQALGAAARDGVDVRLLVPGTSDIPLMRAFSRSGYRPLLESGVRVFEWNGSMLHAKTAVADDRWARVGSTNLNVASWIGNRELDVIVEDERLAREMGEMFLADLENATEIVLDLRSRVRMQAPPPPRRRRGTQPGSGRLVAGAVRLGNTVAAAITNRRGLESVEANIVAMAGLALVAVAVLAFVYPRVLAYPVAVMAGWTALTLLYRGFGLWRQGRRPSGL